MGTDQYHEPPGELSDETRDLARILTSLAEEADAMNWYVQRMEVTKDEQAKHILEHSMEEEFDHLAMDLEYARRKLPKLDEALKQILFTEGDIAEHA